MSDESEAIVRSAASRLNSEYLNVTIPEGYTMTIPANSNGTTTISGNVTIVDGKDSEWKVDKAKKTTKTKQKTLNKSVAEIRDELGLVTAKTEDGKTIVTVAKTIPVKGDFVIHQVNPSSIKYIGMVVQEPREYSPSGYQLRDNEYGIMILDDSFASGNNLNYALKKDGRNGVYCNISSLEYISHSNTFISGNLDTTYYRPKTLNRITDSFYKLITDFEAKFKTDLSLLEKDISDDISIIVRDKYNHQYDQIMINHKNEKAEMERRFAGMIAMPNISYSDYLTFIEHGMFFVKKDNAILIFRKGTHTVKMITIRDNAMGLELPVPFTVKGYIAIQFFNSGNGYKYNGAYFFNSNFSPVKSYHISSSSGNICTGDLKSNLNTLSFNASEIDKAMDDILSMLEIVNPTSPYNNRVDAKVDKALNKVFCWTHKKSKASCGCDEEDEGY